MYKVLVVWFDKTPHFIKLQVTEHDLGLLKKMHQRFLGTASQEEDFLIRKFFLDDGFYKYSAVYRWVEGESFDLQIITGVANCNGTK